MYTFNANMQKPYIHISQSYMREIEWADQYYTGHKAVDKCNISIFACYEDFRICFVYEQCNSHFANALSCLVTAFQSAFCCEERAMEECGSILTESHKFQHDDILDKLLLVEAVSKSGVVNVFEVEELFMDWILIHLAYLNRTYVQYSVIANTGVRHPDTAESTDILPNEDLGMF